VAKHIVILGGGTGGTIMANRLRRAHDVDELVITVVDRDDCHVYQPGLLFVPFGLTTDHEIERPRAKQLHDGIDFHQTEIDWVDIEARTVHLVDGTALDYDVLVVATGARIVPGETEGLAEAMAAGQAHTFYTPDGATALAEQMAAFKGGRIVVNIVDMPIKCPVAPLEFAFLADWFFTDLKRRDEVELVYVTPLDGAFTKPVASATLGGLLEERGIELMTDFNAGEVDGPGGRLVSYDDRSVDYDILVSIPLHSGAEYVGRSPGLGNEVDFVPTDPSTLQSLVRPEIFAIGDAADIPISKAGSVTHFEGEVLSENVRRFLADEPLDSTYDGHANCFIETGFKKALLIDFNYETEPLTGRFPSGAVGPLPLLKESRLNHLGKLMFQWFYWHALLPGRDIPGVGADMPTAGKDFASTAPTPDQEH
jgi:sulfide:quinone oxidoreductase